MKRRDFRLDAILQPKEVSLDHDFIKVTSSEMRASFASILQAIEDGNKFAITNHGKVVGVLTSLEDFNKNKRK